MAGEKSGRVQGWNGERVTVGSRMVLSAVGRVSRMRGVQDSASGAWNGVGGAMNWRPKVRAWATLAFAAAVQWLFMMPSYRQGEPSMAGKTAEDFAVTKDGGRRDCGIFARNSWC